MDFSLSEEQIAVRDLAAQILADLTTQERMAALGDAGFDAQAWRALAQAGLLGVALPEDVGGAGLGFLGAHLLLEAVGAQAAPLPLWETIVMGALPLAHFGSQALRQRWLPGVIDGSVVLTAAVSEDGASDPAQPRTLARRDGDRWELDGTKGGVPFARIASAILVPAATQDGATGVWLVASDADGVTITPQQVITGAPYGEVTLDRVAVDDEALLGEVDGEALRWLLEHGAAGLASLTSGLCAAVLRMSADYTSRREQFGRPVATFQAVAQRVADAYIDTEAAQLTSLQAAWRLTEGLPAADEVAIAKWWASEAGHRVVHAAQHVHGGVGVDREYPLHRYFAAVKQHEFLLGGGTPQLLRLGAAMAAEPV
jgi:3-oxocholest-4-en-26-oyl-CoA dehydrogenase beta subunit